MSIKQYKNTLMAYYFTSKMMMSAIRAAQQQNYIAIGNKVNNERT